MRFALIYLALLSSATAAPMMAADPPVFLGQTCRSQLAPGARAYIEIQNASPSRVMEIYKVNRDCTQTLVAWLRAGTTATLTTNLNAHLVAKRKGFNEEFDFLQVSSSATWKIEEQIVPFNINQLIHCSEMQLNGQSSFYCTLVDPENKKDFTSTMQMIASKTKQVGGALVHPFVSLAKFVFHHNSISWAFNVFKDPKKAASFTFNEGKAWGNFAIGAGKTIAALPLQLAELGGGLVILQYDIYILMHQCILLLAKSYGDISSCKDRWMDPTRIMWTPRFLQITRDQEAGSAAGMIGTMFIDPMQASSAITSSAKLAAGASKLVIPTLEGQVELRPILTFKDGNAIAKPVATIQDAQVAKDVIQDNNVVLSPCSDARIATLSKRMMGDFCFSEINPDYLTEGDLIPNLQLPEKALSDTFDGVDPTLVATVTSKLQSIESKANQILATPSLAYKGYENTLKTMRVRNQPVDDIIQVIKENTGVTLTSQDIQVLDDYVDQTNFYSSEYTDLFKKWPRWAVAEAPVFRLSKIEKQLFDSLVVGQQVPMRKLSQGRDFLAASRTRFVNDFRTDEAFEMVINCRDCKWIDPVSRMHEDEVIVQAPALTYLGRKKVQLKGAGSVWRLYFNQPIRTCPVSPSQLALGKLCI